MKNSNDFLSQNLIFTETTLFFISQNKINIVMDIGEKFLMEKTAELLINDNDDFLEIGFGMGMLANFAQKRNLRTHTIVEAHPMVYEKLLEWSKDKNNVIPIFGDWFSVIDKIKENTYDSVYFDTHSDENVFRFLKMILSSIKDNGRYSRFGLSKKESEIFYKEVSGTNMKLISEDDYAVTPHESVVEFTGNTYPICILQK